MIRYLNKVKTLINSNIVSKIHTNYKLNYKNKGIINFIDVGSVGGLPEPWISNAYLIKYLLNFEPNDTIKQGENFMTYNTAVWEEREVRPFYIYQGFRGTGSSLFKQNYDYVLKNYDHLKQKGPSRLAKTWFERSKLVKEMQLNCDTIDRILLEQFPSTEFHFIKIDAQGAELNILKGAKQHLKNCIGLHLELFNIPMYEGIALLEEVETFLAEVGFDLVKKFPPHGTFNSQNDCLFINREIHEIYTPLIKKVYGLKN